MKQTRIQKHYSNIVAEDIILMYNCQNVMQLPKINKAVLSISSKDSLIDKQQLIKNFATCFLIGGQKGMPTRAQKSISAFQLRKGSIMGCMVTMRKDGMYALLDKIVSFVLPCLQDQPSKRARPGTASVQGENTSLPYRGGGVARVHSPSNWFCEKEQRNIGFGIKEATVFPEIESLFASREGHIQSQKQTLDVLQGLNVLFSFCTHKSHSTRKRGFSKYMLGVQSFQKKPSFLLQKEISVEQSDFIEGQNRAKHMRFSETQKRILNVTTEKQKDLLFLSAFQHPARS